MDTHIARKIEEFDRIYVHENTWKSADQTEAYAPVEGMRQWIFDALQEIAEEARKEAIEDCVVEAYQERWDVQHPDEEQQLVNKTVDEITDRLSSLTKEEEHD